MAGMRRYWLSFTDPDRPVGAQFLGVCLVDVSEAEAAAIVDELAARFPQHEPGAEWVAAAIRKAWRVGCHPGGEVAAVDVSEELGGAEMPLNWLLDRAELVRLGLIDTSQASVDDGR